MILKLGNYTPLEVANAYIFEYIRECEKRRLMVVLNSSNLQQRVSAAKDTGRLLYITKLDRDDGPIEHGNMYLGPSDGYIVALVRL